MGIIQKAQETYKQNFKPTTWFGRCIFLSWYCDVATCKFCFRSTTKHKVKHKDSAQRSLASILTDTIISKNLGWRIEFLTGGYNIFPFEKIVEIAKQVSKIYEKKIWINLGALKKQEMLKLQPYVEGICASIETINPKLHDEICPDKPIKPYEETLKLADELGFKKSITIVIGLGETKQDFELLKQFIQKHKLDRITFYALKPVKETIYKKSPDIEHYSWWIAQTRINFPKIEIISGLTPRKPDYTKQLLDSGANAITKFPILKKFNSEETKLIEKMIQDSGRELQGSLTKLPDINWNNLVDELDLKKELKEKIKVKVNSYIEKIKKKNTK